MEEKYEEDDNDDDLSLHDAIMMSHHMRETDGLKAGTSSIGTVTKERKVMKQDSYFSDEDATSD